MIRNEDSSLRYYDTHTEVRDSTTMTSVQEIDQETEYIKNVTLWVWLIGSPTLLVVGTMGIITSIVVLCRKQLRKARSTVFLLALSIVDELVLCTGLLRCWILYLKDYDIRNYDPLVCKIHIWLVYVTLDVNVWIIVALTVERLFAVHLPYSVNQYFTHRTCIYLTGIVVIVMMAINSHLLYGIRFLPRDNSAVHGANSTKSNESVGTLQCGILSGSYSEFFKNVWPLIDLFVLSLLPVVIIIVCNAVVIKTLMRRYPKLRGIAPTITVSMHDSKNEHIFRPCGIMYVTKILIGLDVMVLLTTMPISIFYVLKFKNLTIYSSERVKANYDLAEALVNMLQYSNNAFHFVLFYLSGSMFREELLKCTREIKPKRRLTISYISTHRSTNKETTGTQNAKKT